jgi:hypothetical protein
MRRRMRSRLTVSAWLLAAACADAHSPPVRCRDGVCPSGQVCLPDEGAICVPTCDAPVVSRCESGARCRMWMGGGVCWPGRTVREGGVTVGPYECAFGLRDVPDFESEPLRFTCQPVCNTDADCRGGEHCSASACRTRCTNSAGDPCASTSHCVASGVCVNERRFARIDCDGDRDLTPECGVSLMCDPDAIGGCTYPPPGEE